MGDDTRESHALGVTSQDLMGRNPPRPWLTLVVTLVGSAMVGLDSTITTVAAPNISADMGATLSQLELITNVYLIALAAGLLPAGWLADRLGRRKIFVVGMIGFGIASLGVALSGHVDALVAFRALQGLMGALISPAALALVCSAFPAAKLGVPLGVSAAGTAVIIGLGPLISGFVVDSFGWPAAFFINVPIALVSVVLTYVVVTESRGPRRKVIRAIRVLFAIKHVLLGTTASAVVSFALFGMFFALTLYLQNVLELSPVAAGTWMLVAVGAIVVSAPISGAIAQRYGTRWLACTGFLVLALGLIGLTSLTSASRFGEILYPSLGIGIGVGCCFVAATETVMGAAPQDLFGVASGLQQVANQVGSALGVAGFGLVVSKQVASTLPEMIANAQLPQPVGDALLSNIGTVAQGVTPDGPANGSATAKVVTQLSFTNAMGAALLVMAGVCVLGALVSLWLKKNPTAKPPAGVVEPSVLATK